MRPILIKNGTVIDGSGKAAYASDVLLNNGNIEKIGEGLTCPHAIVIDATGKLVTPGFINMHSHADCSVAMFPNMESTLGQGITTEFAGHCGLGVAPVRDNWLYMFPEKRAFVRVNPEPIGGINPYSAYIVPTDSLRPAFLETYGEELDWSSYREFLSHLKKRGIGANLAVVAGQANIRLEAMGLDYKRSATEIEICAMEASLAEAMDAGTLGLGLGFDYQPGLFASHEELVRLMKLVSERDGIVTAHTRSRTHDYYGREICFYDGLMEFLELGLETGARIHISHIQNAFSVQPQDDVLIAQSVDRTLEIIESYRQKGVSVTWDVIPKGAFGPFHYPMVASMFQCYVEQCGGVQSFSEKLRVGSYRAMIEAEIRDGRHASRGAFTRFDPKGDPLWDTKQHFTRASNPAIIGKTIREAASGGDSLSFLLGLLTVDPTACIIQHSRRPQHTPARDAFVAQSEATIGLDTWTLDYSAALSDGDMPLECGSPATYEGMTVFLENERKNPIERTIKKLTGNAAQCLRLTDRGYIREGYKADVLVIDYDNFSACERLYDPRHGAKGLDYVIVAGEIAVRGAQHTHILSGSII